MKYHPLFTNEEAKALDAFTVKQLGIPDITLMGMAALSVYHANEDLWETASSIFIVCGTGGNGGDGYALGQVLFQEGYNVTILSIAPNKTEAGKFYESLCKTVGLPLLSPNDLDSFLNSQKSESVLFVDAILGIGFKPPLEVKLSQLIHTLNQSPAVYYTISLDSPSGFFGEPEAIHVEANSIEELGTRKWENVGYVSKEAEEPVPRYYESIGFPIKSHLDRIHQSQTFIWEPNTESAFKKIKRKLNSNKYKSGSAMFYGGSMGMEGAILLSEKVFSYLGGGITKIGSPSSEIQKITLSKDLSRMAKEISLRDFLNDDFLEKTNAIVVGPGLKGIPENLNEIQIPDPITLILDAGAIPLKKEQLPLGKNIIVTPHMGEFSKITGKKYSNIQEAFTDLRSVSKEMGIYVLLKSYVTVLMTPTGNSYVFESPNVKLATMGTGDLLTGILARYISLGEPIEDSVYYALSLLDSVKDLKISNPTAGNILEYLKGVV